MVLSLILFPLCFIIIVSSTPFSQQKQQQQQGWNVKGKYFVRINATTEGVLIAIHRHGEQIMSRKMMIRPGVVGDKAKVDAICFSFYYFMTELLFTVLYSSYLGFVM